MKFSIVTPSLNQGRFIRDCIESVQGQVGVDWEHLVIDGGSTDETVSVLKSYPHLTWVSEPDKGQSDAINKGFRRAQGDYLMWLNADDYLVPGALRLVQDFAAGHANADVIYGDCHYVTNQKGLLRTKTEGEFSLSMLLYYGCYITSTSTFIRRSVLDAGHYLDTSYRVCMDYEYWLRLGHAGLRFEHLPAPLACFRWHETNISTLNAGRRREERLQAQRFYLKMRHRQYLGHPLALTVISRAYQLRRAAGRLRRHLAA